MSKTTIAPRTGALAGFIPWTRPEDEALTEAYNRDGIRSTLLALPSRSKPAPLHRVQRLGLQRRRRWTADDDQHLSALWGTASVAAIARQLKRTPITTYRRAQKIGLQLGCQQGHEYLYAAATRTGYSTGQLREVLKAGGARIWLAMARPNAGRHRCHTVDPMDVDDAVAKWHQAELVHCAATARGMTGETLRAWLEDARADGMAIPRAPKAVKARWRVPTATIEAVIAWRAARESLTAAAMRTGVSRYRLTLWVREAGLPVGRVRPWLLERVAVDRLVAERQARRAA